jgi:hypothetical protein
MKVVKQTATTMRPTSSSVAGMRREVLERSGLALALMRAFHVEMCICAWVECWPEDARDIVLVRGHEPSRGAARAPGGKASAIGSYRLERRPDRLHGYEHGAGGYVA